MKKILSLVLALVMIMSLATTAFAATVESGTAEVKGTYVDNSETDTTVVYKVDIEWEGLSFTYTEGGSYGWNTDTHQYDVLDSDAGWSGQGTITVTNHSNAAVTASFKYAAVTGYEDASVNFSVASLALKSAAETNAAVSGSVTVTPAGKLPKGTSNQVIGNITITVE